MASTYSNKLGKLLVVRVSESNFHFIQQLHFEISKRISLNTGQKGRLDENIRISQNIQGPKSLTEQTSTTFSITSKKWSHRVDYKKGKHISENVL